ncbi:MAG: peptidylprolyl isomerase, partial [Bacteroidetes bacterium]|nr:peptidylprolyl isomerase [Bacteroidota bacterium]
MKNLALLILFLVANSSLFAQSEDILFKVGNESVTLDEFKYIYEKNNSITNNDQLYTRESLDEYLELYIKFKLKVQEAKAQGLDTTAKFVKEYNMYRNQLAQPYLTDKNVTEKLKKEAYDRMHWILRASHILIDVTEDAFPSDTLEAFNLALKAKNEALKANDFATVARKYAKYTKEPTVEKTGGDIGYFSVFNTVYPFENAAYNAKQGEIVGPVRTKFGYHIIKVTEKR